MVSRVSSSAVNRHVYRVVQKSKPLPNYQQIMSKPDYEIRLLRHIGVSSKHYNIIRLYEIFCP